MRVSNKNCRRFVEKCKPFKGSNLFGEYSREGVYVVYSYGYHFPIYAFLNGSWYGNSQKYSVSTSKHQSQARPFNNLNYLKLDDIQRLIRG